jgi:hypothetical protein
VIRLYVLVEGRTEEEFVKRVLEPHLRGFGVWTYPIIVQTKRARAGEKHKGGGDWAKWRRNLVVLSGEHPGSEVRFTTLFDLYGLPDHFPGLSEHGSLTDTNERAKRLEEAMAADIGDWRLIPYLQHLLSSVAPEDVDDGESTAPSKRLAACIPGYQKTVHGPLAVETKGLVAIRKSCPRFDRWVASLERLSEGAGEKGTIPS